MPIKTLTALYKSLTSEYKQYSKTDNLQISLTFNNDITQEQILNDIQENLIVKFSCKASKVNISLMITLKTQLELMNHESSDTLFKKISLTNI